MSNGPYVDSSPVTLAARSSFYHLVGSVGISANTGRLAAYRPYLSFNLPCILEETVLAPVPEPTSSKGPVATSTLAKSIILGLQDGDGPD